MVFFSFLNGLLGWVSVGIEVAVVVDTFAEVRESDVMNLAEEPHGSNIARQKVAHIFFGSIENDRFHTSVYSKLFT